MTASARNPLISLSGAELRALGTPDATAELARRQAKREASGKAPTVAQLRSWGRTDLAAAAVAAAKPAAKPAKAPKAAPAPAPARLTLKALDARIDGLTSKLDAILAKLA